MKIKSKQAAHSPIVVVGYGAGCKEGHVSAPWAVQPSTGDRDVLGKL